MTIQHINPDGMLKSPAFSQGVIVPAGARTLLIGGQNGVGKTYLACAIAQAALRRGHTALYLRAPRLFTDLDIFVR